MNRKLIRVFVFVFLFFFSAELDGNDFFGKCDL